MKSNSSASLQGWRTVTLGDVLTRCQYGMSIATNEAGETPMIGMKEIGDGRVSPHATARTNVTPALFEQFRLREGDILLNRTNSYELVGKTGIVTEDTGAVFASYLVRLNVREDAVLPPYLNAFLNLASTQESLRKLATKGVSQANLNPTVVRQRLLLPLPPLVEQEAIVRVLVAADGAGREAERLLAKAAERKSAVAERLLAAPLSENRDGTEPRGVTPFSAFFRPKDQRAPQSSPVVLSCSKMYGILPQSERFKKAIASTDLRRYKWVVPGDLVYDPMLLWDASISFTALSGVVSPAYETLSWIGDGIGDPRYFRALFDTQALRQIYKTISQGTNARRRKAPVEDFLRVSVPILPLDHQRRVADALDLMDQEIALLRAERDTLRAQKGALLQALLTGALRLPEFRP